MVRMNLLKRANVGLLALLISFAFGSTVVAQAQWLGVPGQRNIGVGASGVFTFGTHGDGVEQSTNPSVGVLVSLHSSYRWTRGLALNYGYNRMNEDIQGTEDRPSDAFEPPATSGQANRHEFTAAYLVKAPKTFWGLQPFALAGGGALAFIPTDGYFSVYHHMTAENTYNQTFEDASYTSRINVASETRAAGLFGAGIDWNEGKHWGGRLEYRALAFLAPSFQQWQINSHGYTLSQMPTLSMFYKF